MIVRYYEAAAVCHPGQPAGQAPTLNDYHRTAWRLFAGDAHYSGEERPFLFRFESLGSDRHLLLLRAAEPFPGATERQQVFKPEETMTLEWTWVPSVATRLSSDGTRLRRSRHVPAPRERWESLLSERLLRQGFLASPSQIRCLPVGSWQQRRDLPAWHEVVAVSAQVTVQDAELAAYAWLGGISRLRTYGMGMLLQNG